MKKRYRISSLLFAIASLVISCSNNSEEDNKVKEKRIEDASLNKKSFTFEEKKEIDSDSFKRLNEIKYNEIIYHHNDISDEMLSGLNKFTSDIYKNCSSEYGNNFLLSSINLYYALSNAYKGISDDEIKQEFDLLLNTSESLRDTNLPKIFDNLFSENENGITKIHNGVFIDCEGELKYSQDFVNELTRLKTEAFQYNHNNSDDVNKMVDWVNYNTNTTDLLKKEDLKLDQGDDKKTFFFSTLYFDQNWGIKFFKEKTKIDSFYPNSSNSYNVDYLNHSLQTYYKDFDNYFSVTDYYKNDYSIEYIASKTSETDIFSVIDLNDVLNKKTSTQKYVDLYVPKFKYGTKGSLNSIIKNSGITKAFEADRKGFNNIYENFNGYSYLSNIVQGNQIALSEDSTKIESYVYVEIGAEMESAPEDKAVDGITVKLNRPFVYIIKDKKNVPIFIGHITKPNKSSTELVNVIS